MSMLVTPISLLFTFPLAIIFTNSTTTTTTITTNTITTTTTTTTTTKPNAINLDPIITLSPSLLEDDGLLFQLASQANPNPIPSKPKKIAFMFLTTTPLPLAPLWEVYFHRTPKNLYNIYIHADPSSEYASSFHGVFKNRTIPSKPTCRHSPTLIEAHRRLLSHALLDDPSNYMFALLSSSCIPLHSFKFTYKTLISSRMSFLEILKNGSYSSSRWGAHGSDAMLPEVTLQGFRIGSQFSVLTRKHAKMAVSDNRIWDKYKMPCVYEHVNDCYPEENYLPTLFNMIDPDGCIPATLTHVDWNGTKDGHPRTYIRSDVEPSLIWNLRKDRPRYGDEEDVSNYSSLIKRHHPFLFARKFAVNTTQPLLSIANDVIFKD